MSSKNNATPMLQKQLDDEYNYVMQLCKSDVESGPNQLALNTVIDKQEQVKVCLAEMQMRVLALDPFIGFMEVDPVMSSIIFGDEDHGVQISCVTGGALAVQTTMLEAQSLIVAKTNNTTATLRVKNVYTDEMIDAEVEVRPNAHRPEILVIRYISGVINITGDPKGMKEIGKYMDICISLAVAMLHTPVLSAANRRRAASVAAGSRRCV